MGCIGWRCMEGGFDDCLDLSRRNFGNTTGTGRILFESLQSKSQEPLPPKLYGWPGYTQFLCDILVLHSIRSHSDDQCSLHQPQGEAFSSCPGVHLGTFLWTQYNGSCAFHNGLAYRASYHMSIYLGRT